MSHGITSDVLETRCQVDNNAVKHHVDHLSKALRDLEARLDQADNREAQLVEQLHADLEPKSQLVIRNELTFKVHRGVECRTGTSATWSTLCGWKYAGRVYSRHRGVPSGTSKKDSCGRCLPFERQTLNKDLNDMSESD